MNTAVLFRLKLSKGLISVVLLRISDLFQEIFILVSGGFIF